MSEQPFRARAFGQDWAADLPLVHFDALSGEAPHAGFKVRRISRLPQRCVIARKGRGEICADGFRFIWTNVATFDVQAARQINYLPLDGWRGTMPDTFFSTVAALAMSGIGMLPMHASAIELDGRAFLFAGKAGVGKSTLTAELLADGARLIGDDLTVLAPPEGERGFRVTRGRPAMRLHPATARLVDTTMCEIVSNDARGKLLVRPGMRAEDEAYPLAGIFLLETGPAAVSPSEALRLLPLHLFRPRWMGRMPGHGQRHAWLLDLAGKVPVRRLPAVESFDPEARRLRTHSALAAMAG